MVVNEDNNGRFFYNHELSNIEKLEASSKLKGASPEGKVGTFETLQAKDKLANVLFGVNENGVSKVVDENGEMLGNAKTEAERDMIDALIKKAETK